ncbi:carboxymuconolactone decarboxylase family protein [Sedimenticola sp.]|uniref:carboxymuconolactone decarboxylase family protein n=1 Tax=Sedimenticola sp. TaxID=1940285 RepID=UPI003D0C44D2
MRVSAKPFQSYPWYLKPFFWNQKRKYGEVLNPGLLWGRVPRIFMAVAALFGAFESRRSTLAPALRSLITVRVSQINWCEFCVDINSRLLAERCGTMDKVMAVEHWRESDLFNDRERVVLDYVESVTYSDRQVNDEQIEALHRHFNEDAIVELTGMICFQNMASKFNAALDVPAQGFCKRPR